MNAHPEYKNRTSAILCFVKKGIDENKEYTRRCKQIEIGKNTAGYRNYIRLVPEGMRRLEPPNPRLRISKRSWGGLYNVWRQKLHLWDPVDQSTSDRFQHEMKFKHVMMDLRDATKFIAERLNNQSSVTGYYQAKRFEGEERISWRFRKDRLLIL